MTQLALGVLKQLPEDFLVREVAVPPTVPRALATHQLLVMRKHGVSTPTAIFNLASVLKILPQEITYCGRKDEEGITEQLVAVPATVDASPIMEQMIPVGADSWLAVHHHGFGSRPLVIGALLGNSFSITVRDLSQSAADYLWEQRRVNLFFLNYYDTQRFGVPEGPKRTHLVGRALLAGDFATALAEISELRSAESEAARSWTEDPAKFFSRLDDRVVAFFLSAAESARWNDALIEQVRCEVSRDLLPLSVESLPYVFLTEPDAPLAVLAAARELPYVRYEWSDGRAIPRETLRPTVVQTLVNVAGVAESAGAWRASLDFFLPSGCYATMAVRQLIAFACRLKPGHDGSSLETGW